MPPSPSQEYEIRLSRELICAEKRTGRVLLKVIGQPIKDHGLSPDAMYDGISEMLRLCQAQTVKLAIVVADPETRRVYAALRDAAAFMRGDASFASEVFSEEDCARNWLVRI